MINVYATPGDYSRYVASEEQNQGIKAYLELASIEVNRATLSRIEKKGFNNLTEKQRDLITKATCFQAKYIKDEGLYDDDELISYSIGGDLTVNKQESQAIHNKLKLSKQAYVYLRQTGLMSRIT